MPSATFSISALEKYRPGQSEPILIGGEKLLKPALRLMSFYRLRIDEIKGAAVVTSYTRWLGSVQARGAENQEVYVAFSPRFERIWLESKKRLPEYVSQKPANLGTAKSICDPPLRLGQKIRLGRKEAHLFGAPSKSARAGVGKRRRRKYHPRSSATDLGELSSEGAWTLRLRRSTERRT